MDFAAPRMWLNRLSLFLFLLLLTSCITHTVKTDAFVSEDELPSGFPKKTSFAIIPKNKSNPLFQKESAQELAAYLKGLKYQVTIPENADYILVFEFDLSSKSYKKYEEKRSSPQVNRTVDHLSDIHGARVVRENTYVKEGKSVVVPTVVTRHIKTLNLAVYTSLDAFIDGQDEIWSCSSTISDGDEDLRFFRPYLYTAALAHFGKSSGRQVQVELSADDLQKY